MNIIWLSPAVLFALGAVAAPVLIHILVQRRAERFPFPTLRFLQPTRLAAIRRHVLEDAALLAVRAAIFAAAVMALAGPLVITAARRQAWDRRVVRAVVVDERAPERGALQETGVARPFQSREFSGTSLRDAVARAVTWLETAPPARRELVIVSPLAIGSSDAADIAAVPASIGIRFERRGDLPPTRTVAAGRLIGSSGMLTREVTLSGAQTSVREAIAQGTQAATSWPIEAVASPAAQPSIDAAVAAVLSGRVWAPRPNQRARLLIVESAAESAVAQALAEAAPMRAAWMANAAAYLARDAELQAAAVRAPRGFSDDRFSAAPWQIVASAADGRPIVAVAGSPDRVVVASAAGAADIVTPLLIRSIANGVGDLPDDILQRAEVVPIADRLLSEWSRPAAPPAIDGDQVGPEGDALFWKRASGLRRERVGERGWGPVRIDDARWVWLAVLCLLGVEMWMRRARKAAAEDREEIAHVA